MAAEVANAPATAQAKPGSSPHRRQARRNKQRMGAKRNLSVSLQTVEGFSSPSPPPSETSDAPPMVAPAAVGAATPRAAEPGEAGALAKGGRKGRSKLQKHRKKRQARRRLESAGSSVPDSPKHQGAKNMPKGTTRTISESTAGSSTDSLLDLKLTEGREDGNTPSAAPASSEEGRGGDDDASVPETEYSVTSDAQDDTRCQAASPELSEATDVAQPSGGAPVFNMPALKYTRRCYDMVRDILTTLDIKGAARSLEKAHKLCESDMEKADVGSLKPVMKGRVQAVFVCEALRQCWKPGPRVLLQGAFLDLYKLNSLTSRDFLVGWLLVADHLEEQAKEVDQAHHHAGEMLAHAIHHGYMTVDALRPLSARFKPLGRALEIAIYTLRWLSEYFCGREKTLQLCSDSTFELTDSCERDPNDPDRLPRILQKANLEYLAPVLGL